MDKGRVILILLLIPLYSAQNLQGLYPNIPAQQKVILQIKVVPEKGAKPTGKPVTTAPGGTAPPGGGTTAPGGGTTTPGGGTTAPGGGTTAPGGETTAPGGGTTAPGGGTTAPGGGTTAPGGGTTAPGGGTTAPGGGTDGMPAFRKEALQASNNMRLIHKAPDFQMDASLNEQAQKYAEKLASTKNPSVHSKTPGQGENLGHRCNSLDKPYPGKDIVKAWYDEVKLYDFVSPAFNPKTGHFTQLVWKGSTKLGIGRAKYVDNTGLICYVVVGRYSPQGNIQGQFMQNVLKGGYSG